MFADGFVSTYTIIFNLTFWILYYFQGAAVSTDAATGEVVDRPEGYEPPVMETV